MVTIRPRTAEATPDPEPIRRKSVSQVLTFPGLTIEDTEITRQVDGAIQDACAALRRKLGPWWLMEGGPVVTQLYLGEALHLLVTVVGQSDEPLHPDRN